MNTDEVNKMEHDGSNPEFMLFRFVADMSFDANSTIKDLVFIWKPKVHHRAHKTFKPYFLKCYFSDMKFKIIQW
jgi:hypothetical protein